MCAIFLSHFVFAVFWRTLVAFGFVFHHDWFCRLYKGLNLREYFDVKYYIIDPSLDPDNEDEVQSTPDNEIGNNPLDGLIKVDTILASRDFSDPEGQTDSDIDTLSKQFQQYYKSSRQLYPLLSKLIWMGK